MSPFNPILLSLIALQIGSVLAANGGLDDAAATTTAIAIAAATSVEDTKTVATTAVVDTKTAATTAVVGTATTATAGSYVLVNSNVAISITGDSPITAGASTTAKGTISLVIDGTTTQSTAAAGVVSSANALTVATASGSAADSATYNQWGFTGSQSVWKATTLTSGSITGSVSGSATKSGSSSSGSHSASHSVSTAQNNTGARHNNPFEKDLSWQHGLVVGGVFAVGLALNVL